MVDEERCAQCYGTPFSFPLPSVAIQIIMIFLEMLNQTWFLSYLIVPLWYNNVNWDNDNTK